MLHTRHHHVESLHTAVHVQTTWYTTFIDNHGFIRLPCLCGHASALTLQFSVVQHSSHDTRAPPSQLTVPSQLACPRRCPTDTNLLPCSLHLIGSRSPAHPLSRSWLRAHAHLHSAPQLYRSPHVLCVD